MNRSHPRWLLPFVFAGATIGHAPDVVEPLFQPAVAAVLVGGVALVVGAAVVFVAVVTASERDGSERDGEEVRRG